MRIAEMNWSQVEAQVARDDRCLWPIGSTEQHAQLSLAVDTILSERVAVEAAEPLGLPVFPVMPFGLAPYFSAYPGTVTLRVETLLAVARDVIASLDRSGFRRILMVNGHGGNAPVGALARELMAERPHLSIKLHDWWAGPRFSDAVARIDPHGSHANWMENFPWTRLATAPAPEGEKPLVDKAMFLAQPPDAAREMLGDGSFGSAWERDDNTMRTLWAVGVEETRTALEGPWATPA